MYASRKAFSSAVNLGAGSFKVSLALALAAAMYSLGFTGQALAISQTLMPSE